MNTPSKVETRRRARLEFYDNAVVKIPDDPAAVEAEARWYRLVPWATPELLHVDNERLVVARYPTSAELGPVDWRPVTALRALLERLWHDHGIHHRDVHAKNIVRMPDGTPRLIDWETAVVDRSARDSYDLIGPTCGVPKPDVHEGFSDQWWGARTRFSVARWWGLNDSGGPRR